jgi:apolipoprotein N-acyltransferase
MTINQYKIRAKTLDLISLLAGGGLVLSFSPFNLSFFSFISIAVLFFITIKSSSKRSAWRGFIFGLGFFGVGVSWVFISINTFGYLTSNTIINTIIAVALTAILVLFLSLYIAVATYLSSLISNNKTITQKAILFSVIWVLIEFLRGWAFTGFPWLYIGYSQTNTIFSSLAAIGGVYLVSLAVSITSTFIIAIIIEDNYKIKAYLSLSIIIIFLFSFSIFKMPWTTESQPNQIKVSLIQANISQNAKWDPNQVNRILKKYSQLTQENLSPLVFWSENSIPVFPDDAKQFLSYINELGIKNHSAILVGLPYMNHSTGEYYNSAQVLGYGHGQYLKHHLVPFGEYFPLSKILGPTLSFINIPASNFSSGPIEQTNLVMHKVNVSLFICYEIAFPTQVQIHSKKSELIAVISDDAWFGDSLGPWQHMQIAQMRAIENGRYVVQSTNDGITAIINQYGSVIKKLPQFKSGVLSGDVQLYTGQTPWQRYGATPVFMLLILLLFMAIQPFTKQQNKK